MFGGELIFLFLCVGPKKKRTYNPNKGQSNN
jgi:hypothetical protein